MVVWVGWASKIPWLSALVTWRLRRVSTREYVEKGEGARLWGDFLKSWTRGSCYYYVHSSTSTQQTLCATTTPAPASHSPPFPHIIESPMDIPATTTIDCNLENNNDDSPNDNNNHDDVDCFPPQDKQPVLPQDDISSTVTNNTYSFPSLIESPTENPPILWIPIIITTTAPTIIIMMITRSFTTTDTMIKWWQRWQWWYVLCHSFWRWIRQVRLQQL